MKPSRILLITTIVVALLGIGTAWAWALSMGRELRDKEVAYANSLAARDTAIVRIIAAAGDSQVAVTRRLAYQGEVDLQMAREAFDTEINDSVEVWATSLAQFRIRGDSLERELIGRDAEVDTAGTITVVGELDAMDSLGMSVSASVEIPPTLVSPLWRWNVARAPLTLSVGLRCEGTLAVAYVTGPPWATIAVDSVVQDATICNPIPSGWRPFEIRMPSVPALVTLLTAGAVLESKFHVFSGGNP